MKNNQEVVFAGGWKQLQHAKLKSIEPLLLTQMLIALLNMPDHGDHEACTVVALLLKLGRNHHDLVVDECLRALKENKAPSFYLNEVIEKILK